VTLPAPSTPDPKFAASLARPAVDLRRYLPAAAPNQGPRPLCVPFAISGAHAGQRCHANGKAPIAFSAEALWRSCLRSGYAGPDGTTLSATADALASTGQPAEADWPYNSALGHGTEAPPPQVGPPPWLLGTLAPVPLEHDEVEEPLEDSVGAGQLVVLILELTDEFAFPDRTGEIAMPPITAPDGDYHAVLVVGAGTDSTYRSRRLLIQNSWGSGWGLGGYAWLPIRYLEAFAVQAGSIDASSLR